MKKTMILLAFAAASWAQAPRIYIPPQDGYETYLAAALLKKHVPVVITQNKEQAQFILAGGAKSKEDSTGSKVLNCLVMFCVGITGTTDATVQLVTPTGEIRWAYSTRIGFKDDFRRSAEDLAKHLKKFLEEHPQ